MTQFPVFDDEHCRQLVEHSRSLFQRSEEVIRDFDMHRAHLNALLDESDQLVEFQKRSISDFNNERALSGE